MDLADIQVLFEHIRLFFISSFMHLYFEKNIILKNCLGRGLSARSYGPLYFGAFDNFYSKDYLMGKMIWNFTDLAISLRNKTTRLPSTTVSNYSK